MKFALDMILLKVFGCIQHNEEIQSNHFGGGARVSIEGYTVHYPEHMDGSSLIFDFLTVS